MKKSLLIIFLTVSTVYADSYISGSYNTWLGYYAGTNATANYSTMFGAWAGAGAASLSKSFAAGTMAAYESSYLDNCFIAGFRAMQDASDINDVIAIGNNAGRDSAGANNCLWLGRGVGRGLGSAENEIRLLPGWYQYNNTYTTNVASSVAAQNVYLFGRPLSTIIQDITIPQITSRIPTALSSFNNDSGYVTSSDVSSAISSATSGFITSSNLDGSYVKRSAYDGIDLCVYEGGHYDFKNNAGRWGFRFTQDWNNDYGKIGFTYLDYNFQYGMIEEVNEHSIFSLSAYSAFLAKTNSAVWFQSPNQVYVGGTNKTSATTLPEYFRSISNVQSVNGQTGAITITANDLNAMPKFSTNTTVRLITDDDAFAAIRLILTTMGATVITNTPSAN